MKQLKKLTRKHKELLTKRKFDATKYLLERQDNEKYVFVNVETKEVLVVWYES